VGFPSLGVAGLQSRSLIDIAGIKVLGGGRSTSHRNDDFAHETFGVPVEANLALQLASNDAVHHARAEALTCRWLDRRATRLGPAKNEASV